MPKERELPGAGLSHLETHKGINSRLGKRQRSSGKSGARFEPVGVGYSAIDRAIANFCGLQARAIFIGNLKTRAHFKSEVRSGTCRKPEFSTCDLKLKSEHLKFEII